MITQLKNRALLKLSGPDAQSFLHNQLSNDVNALKAGEVQLNAYCQHQGKIIALFWLIQQGSDYYLSFPEDLKSLVVQRFTMFKLMSVVEIEDLSDQVIQLGVIDEVFEGSYRFNNQQSVALVEDAGGLELVDDTFWNKACIDNQVPEVSLATSEKFVPQMLNLDIDEMGVSFTKGCYPGQEVVARLHYLGEAKRRLYRFESTHELQVGDELLASDSISAKASGMVVSCVASESRYLCLATMEVAHKDGQISLKSVEGSRLTRID